MKKLIIIVITLVALTGISFAGQAEFKFGFGEGYKIVKGGHAMIPMCPMRPITPIGSTDFREGVKRGIIKAGGNQYHYDKFNRFMRSQQQTNSNSALLNRIAAGNKVNFGKTFRAAQDAERDRRSRLATEKLNQEAQALENELKRLEIERMKKQ